MKIVHMRIIGAHWIDVSSRGTSFIGLNHLNTHTKEQKHISS